MVWLWIVYDDWFCQEFVLFIVRNTVVPKVCFFLRCQFTNAWLIKICCHDFTESPRFHIIQEVSLITRSFASLVQKISRCTSCRNWSQLNGFSAFLVSPPYVTIPSMLSRPMLERQSRQRKLFLPTSCCFVLSTSWEFGWWVYCER